MRTFSNFAAVVLIALAVSPFTAPFSSCDLATLFGEGTPVTGEAGTSKDATMAGAIVVAPARIEDRVTIFNTILSRVIPTGHIAPTILRV